MKPKDFQKEDLSFAQSLAQGDGYQALDSGTLRRSSDFGSATAGVAEAIYDVLVRIFLSNRLLSFSPGSTGEHGAGEPGASPDKGNHFAAMVYPPEDLSALVKLIAFDLAGIALFAVRYVDFPAWTLFAGFCFGLGWFFRRRPTMARLLSLAGFAFLLRDHFETAPLHGLWLCLPLAFLPGLLPHYLAAHDAARTRRGAMLAIIAIASLVVSFCIGLQIQETAYLVIVGFIFAYARLSLLRPAIGLALGVAILMTFVEFKRDLVGAAFGHAITRNEYTIQLTLVLIPILDHFLFLKQIFRLIIALPLSVVVFLADVFESLLQLLLISIVWLRFWPKLRRATSSPIPTQESRRRLLHRRLLFGRTN